MSKERFLWFMIPSWAKLIFEILEVIAFVWFLYFIFLSEKCNLN